MKNHNPIRSSSSFVLAAFVLVVSLGFWACSNGLLGNADSAGTNAGNFPVSVVLNEGGIAGARTAAFNNGLVNSVFVIVYSSATGERTGSGSLTRTPATSNWRGDITVSENASAVFEANALNYAGSVLYVGRHTQTLTGSGDQVTIPVSLAGLKAGSIQGYVPTLSTAVKVLAGSLSSLSGSVEGTGTDARFTNPYGMATDGTFLYVASRGDNNIRKIVIATQVETIFAGKLGGDAGDTNATGQAAAFRSPSGITTDGTNLYVADTVNHTIRKIVIATQVVSTFAGTSTLSGATDGTGTGAMFYDPEGITTDGTNLYVADTGNHKIRQIVISTGVVTTLSGTPSGDAGVFGTNDGDGTAARFHSPQGITTDGTYLYVTDTANSTIRKILIAAPNTVTTIAGQAGVTGIANGIGTAALFDGPRGITSDGTNLYVTDWVQHTVRKIVISSGVVSALAGLAGTGNLVDGTGADAHFYGPSGIATDGTNLYVSDYSSHTIRKIQ